MKKEDVTIVQQASQLLLVYPTVNILSKAVNETDVNANFFCKIETIY